MSVKPTASERSAERVAEVATGSIRSEDKSRRTCYLCHQVCHMRKLCPLNSQGSKGATEQVAVCQEVSSVDKKTKTCSHNLSAPGTLELRCGCQMPYVGCLSESVSSQIVACLLLQVKSMVTWYPCFVTLAVPLQSCVMDW